MLSNNILRVGPLLHSILGCISLIAISVNAAAQDIPPAGSTVHAFIPKGWKNILQTSGDLNKDKLPDEVLIIENTDPGNLLPNEGLGGDTLNTNPRALLILFRKAAGGYSLAARNDAGFVPPRSNPEVPCLSDPLLDDGGMDIGKGVLRISYNYWLSCGSWYVSSADYTFRYQHNAFELIGFDYHSMHRASGASGVKSINFSTRKVQEIDGINDLEPADNNPKTTWRSITFPKLLRLEKCDSTTYEIMGSL